MPAASVRRITPAEYLAADRAAEFRSEYHDGQMYSMSGGTYAHALLVGGMGTELRLALRKKHCTVTPSQVRLQAVPNGPYVFPPLADVYDKVSLTAV